MRHRARYAVPGADLTVEVDVAVADGSIAAAQVALSRAGTPQGADALARALVGAPAAAGTDALTTRLRAVVPRPAEGREGEEHDDGALAVAIAVRRALAGATDWPDHVFDVVHDGPVPPAVHMALDEVVAESVGAGRRRPTLRMWEWERPAVVLGSFQSVANEVDPEGAARHGVTVVRRISGGGAMFVEPGRTITYSLVVPASLVAGMSFAASYAFLDAWAVDALRALGVQARYVPLNDIASPRGKIAGAAQKRLATGAVLHHVTMAYDMDNATMLEVLRTFRPPVAGRGTTSAQKLVDPLRRQTALPREAVVGAMLAHFRGRYATVDGAVSDAEWARAEDLVRTKFGTDAWTARLP